MVSIVAIDPDVAFDKDNSDAGLMRFPAGLWRLILFQFWDNLAFSGSRLLLVLFLLDLLTQPSRAAGTWGLVDAELWGAARLGLQGNQAFISATVGLFGVMTFLMPVVGGYLSDRFVSRRSAVITGSLLMAMGHAMLAFQSPALVGLFLLACGNGLYRSSVSATLAGIFPRGDPRLSSAFQLSYTASNVAVVAASLICGTLGELMGWSWGFGAAAVSMVIGLVTYLSIPKQLLCETRGSTDPVDQMRSSVWLRILLIAGVALFMVGNEQLGNAMVVWLKTAVDRHILSLTIPVTWFFTIVPIAVTITTLVLARARLQDAVSGMRRRMVVGCIVGGGGWTGLAFVAKADPVPGIWVIVFLLVWGLACSLVVASGASLMAILTPAAKRGQWMGLYLLVGMIGSLAVAWLGGLYGRMNHPAFIALHGAIVLAAAILLLALPRRGVGSRTHD